MFKFNVPVLCADMVDHQERKMELYQAILKMEENGSAEDSIQVQSIHFEPVENAWIFLTFLTGYTQVHADRIQSDLDELVKALNERCKKYGLYVKPTTLVELPFGNFI